MTAIHVSFIPHPIPHTVLILGGKHCGKCAVQFCQGEGSRFIYLLLPTDVTAQFPVLGGGALWWVCSVARVYIFIAADVML